MTTKIKSRQYDQEAITADLRTKITETADGGLEIAEGVYYEIGSANGLDEQTLRDVAGFDRTFVASAVRAMGQASFDMMAAASDITQMTGTFHAGARTGTFHIEKQHEYPNPSGEGTVMVYGATTVKVEDGGGKGIKKAREEIKKSFKDMFGADEK